MSDAADTNLDAFGRTPVEAAADAERFAADLERERRKLPDGGDLRPPVRKEHVDDGVTLEETLKRIRDRVNADGDAELAGLVCRDKKHADEDAGVDACTADGAFRDCRWRHQLSVCPRARAIEFEERVADNLSSPPAMYRVPPRESEVILASVRRTERQKLWTLDSLTVVRSALERKRIRVPLENGVEVRREPGQKPTRHPGEVFFVGNEVLVVLTGNQGRGKTLAACYAIARQGGIYTRAPQWTRRGGVDVEQAIAAPVLVIDQFGREHWGESHWTISQLEDVIDTRSQSLSKWTFLVGNLTVEQFLERVKDTTIADRVIGGYGVFVEFGGESVRAGMRAAAMKGA